MTAAAIAVFVAAALIPIVPAVLRGHDVGSVARRPRAAMLLDGVTAGAMIALAGTAAIIATTTGPARGAGLVIATCAAMAAAVGGGGFVVRVVLWTGGVSPHRKSGENTDPPTHPDDDGSESGPLRGGRVIGYLERATVAATLLAGWPEGLAVILAVKSLARFPELRAPHASEQFIMGTFASVLWAASMSGVCYLVVH
ncbi:hypothetical protein [Gordonia sp. SL306]|uniref:hypothetical protein n=1 Tax=Gordonia sp. SL306 TaxID=2995145 RepID=UPI002271B17A|nr:hypothetical protein [Gordonia sp. SL306]WAC55377.1 hypothetical protein OVA31_22710 [Gordonia sp. SL306]